MPLEGYRQRKQLQTLRLDREETQTILIGLTK